jgi:acyl-CoA-binding protein
MTDLTEAFNQAVNAVQNNKPTKPIANDIKLQMYALYKQATLGDISGKKPSALDMVGRAKYTAWEALKGLSIEEAKRRYINTFNQMSAQTGANIN